MAKINIEFDTNTKMMTCTMDGTPIPNISNCYIGMCYEGEEDDEEDEYCCELVTMEEDESNKTRKYTRIMASENEKLETNISEVIKKIFSSHLKNKPKFNKVLEEEVSKYFAGK